MATTSHLTFQPHGIWAPITMEVNSVSFDAEQMLNVGSTTGGAGAGKVTFNPFSFQKKPDAHSAELWLKLCNGGTYQKVSFDVTKQVGSSAGSAGSPFFTFAMGLVAIKTISVSVDDEDGPTETVTLEYGQAAYSVTPQNVDGTPGTPIGTGWDRVKNIAVDVTNVGAV